MTTFDCAACGGRFEMERSEANAEIELSVLFPGVSKENCDTVCDACFSQIVDSETRANAMFADAPQATLAHFIASAVIREIIAEHGAELGISE